MELNQVCSLSLNIPIHLIVEVKLIINDMLRINNNIKPAQIVSKLRNANFNVREEDMPTREQVSGYKSRQMTSVRGASNTTEQVRNLLN